MVGANAHGTPQLLALEHKGGENFLNVCTLSLELSCRNKRQRLTVCACAIGSLRLVM